MWTFQPIARMQFHPLCIGHKQKAQQFHTRQLLCLLLAVAESASIPKAKAIFNVECVWDVHFHMPLTTPTAIGWSSVFGV